MLVSYGLKLAVLLPVLGEHNGSQAHLKAGVATVPLRGRLLGCVLKKLAFCTLGRWHRWTSSWNWSDQCSRNPEHTYPLWSLRNEYWMMPPSTRGLLMMLQFTSWSWHQLDKTLPHLNPVLWRKCKCFPSAEKRGPVEKIEMLLPVWLKHCLCLGWCFLFCLFVLGFFIWGPPPPPLFFLFVECCLEGGSQHGAANAGRRAVGMAALGCDVPCNPSLLLPWEEHGPGNS